MKKLIKAPRKMYMIDDALYKRVCLRNNNFLAHFKKEKKNLSSKSQQIINFISPEKEEFLS
jgi:hypothetical protein